ncbi:MAG: DUF4302 domain-containing protein [Bacteroides sp.]|nr:DUF4302 domain-containing protein [Bacteroides sp.]
MKKKYLIWILLPFIFQSCLMDDKDLFPESAADRMNTVLKHHQEILMGATNGWILEYFPEKKQSYGGYTLFVKFEPHDMVTVASELYKADQTETSMYQLIGDSGPVLTFNTHNTLLHYFSDPHNPDGIGPGDSGMGGDYEFLMLESTPGKVTMKGKKTGNRIVMTPIASDANWTDLMKDYQLAAAKIKGKKYKLSMGELEGTALASYRTFNITYPGDNAAIEMIMASYRVLSSNEIEFYEPLKIGGKEITKMKFSVDADGVITFTDVQSGLSLVELLPVLNQELVKGSWYFAYSKLGTYGKQCWDLAKTGLDAIGEQLYSAALTNGISFAFGCVPNGASTNYKGILGFSYQLIDIDQIKLSYTGTSDNNGGYYYKNSPNFPQLINPLLGQFKLIANDKKNPTTIQLQDIAKPENVYVLSRSAVYWPYNK